VFLDDVSLGVRGEGSVDVPAAEVGGVVGDDDLLVRQLVAYDEPRDSTGDDEDRSGDDDQD
jgi:hypothetical protein